MTSEAIVLPAEPPVAPGPIAMSFAEWVALPEDEPGEWVDGYLVEEEMPSLRHEMVVLWIGSLLRAWAVPRGGVVAGSGVKCAVSPHRGRMPDVVVFLHQVRHLPREGAVATPPDIAVEVVSSTPRDQRRDRVEKLNEYAQWGVRFYWLVDPQLRSVEILELGSDGRYVHQRSATEGAIEQVPGCEGLRVDLTELWAEIDRVGAEEPSGI